ncbi:MAG: GMC family oxidoreductase [Gammaproteobacteria bacterium]|nr:GMC family oxidoreductase [Gammaproteobacteria bacterium]
MTKQTVYDAIVIGSGITGGWAAKELTEKGLKVLLVERGKNIPHRSGYKNEMRPPWEMPFRGEGDQNYIDEHHPIQQHSGHLTEWNRDYWVDDKAQPYQTPGDSKFNWIRGYHLGGKSLMWGRQCYRWSDYDFSANARDGIGTDWPIRYKDIAPWYDKVESFVGISGAKEALPQLPDGQFQPPMALNAVEQYMREQIAEHFPERRLTIGRTANLTEGKPDEGRAPCQNRSICSRGCSFGAYFSTQSSTLPAAQKTGNLTLLTNSMASRLIHDPDTNRISGVDVLDTQTRQTTTYRSKLVFLCAGAFNSVALLLRSVSEAFPNGLANSSGVLGKYIMDHASTVGVASVIPGFNDRYYYGNRPTGVVIPRFVNLDSQEQPYTRGFSYQGGAYRAGWTRGMKEVGIGESFARDLQGPGDWKFVLTSFAECLPRAENHITLDTENTDADGFPQLQIHFAFGDNEHQLLKAAKEEAAKMVTAAGGKVLFGSDRPNPGGSAIHEMGGARMGRDSKTSVLNGYNQAHDVPNLFVTDGAAMASSACQNPSLTYMALTARAAEYAASQLAKGLI